ncbi:hypothetical protein CRG98_039157 [Punica granatum]|uniref:Uncharacterized protein n=1 Tax=Punica granatum TaxID=22663 RepID=A0A2I0I9H6_PUNGR|nr:hypothetical protein CRG98_039157 [Punica granatum]
MYEEKIWRSGKRVGWPSWIVSTETDPRGVIAAVEEEARLAKVVGRNDTSKNSGWLWTPVSALFLSSAETVCWKPRMLKLSLEMGLEGRKHGGGKSWLKPATWGSHGCCVRLGSTRGLEADRGSHLAWRKNDLLADSGWISITENVLGIHERGSLSVSQVF